MLRTTAPLSGPAAFGRLCVETAMWQMKSGKRLTQPPSGGCVLKLKCMTQLEVLGIPAAFGRLCVETVQWVWQDSADNCQPPSGGCVLKQFTKG